MVKHCKNNIFRSKETSKRYREYTASLPPEAPHFHDWQERLVREFDGWLLIENAFPFDQVAEIHHLLIPKRAFGSLKEANEGERAELEEIKEALSGGYDFMLENFPRNRSILEHYHLHLVVLKEAE